jgi:hypothetical protein
MGSSGVFKSELSALSLQQFINYSSDFATLALVDVEVSSCVSLLQKAMTPCIPLPFKS